MKQKLTITLEFTDFNEFIAFQSVLKNFKNNEVNIQKEPQDSVQPNKHKRGRHKKSQETNMSQSVIKNDIYNKNKCVIYIHKRFGNKYSNQYLNLYDKCPECANTYYQILLSNDVNTADKYYNKWYNNFRHKKPYKCKNPRMKHFLELAEYDTLNDAIKNKKKDEYVYICRVTLHKKIYDEFPKKYYCLNPELISKDKVLSTIRHNWLMSYNEKYNENKADYRIRENLFREKTNRNFQSCICVKTLC
jgi:hypothetical protein